MRVIINWSQSDVQYVAVVVGCELGVEDRSFVRLLKMEEGDCTVSDSGCQLQWHINRH